MYRSWCMALCALCVAFCVVSIPANAYIIGDPNQPPTITINIIPGPCTYGNYAGWIYGSANNVNTDSVDVVVYSRTNVFWRQSTPQVGIHVPINSSGGFSRNVYCGEVYYALLVKKTWDAPYTMYYLPTLSTDVRAIACNPDRRYTLSGWHWWGKGTADALFDPGSNFFSDSPDHLWTDGNGSLHLRLSKTDGYWRSPEVYSRSAFPYGRFQFAVDGPICDLDPRVVFSGFTYVLYPTEVDIEMSVWGDTSTALNAQYIVQPDGPGRKYRFTCPPLSQTNHEMIWWSDRVTFTSREGGAMGYGNVIATWSFTGTGIPQESDSMRCHFNCWTLDSSGTMNHLPVEVAVTAFSFTPIVLVSVPDLRTSEIVVLRSAPNPVRDRMRLTFNLPSGDYVTLNLYDVQGRLVSSVVDREWFAPGVHHLDATPPTVAGMYFLKLVAGNHVAVNRVSVVR